MTEKAVVIISGGLDSTVLLYYVLSKGYEVFALSFNYGQRHKRELDYAKRICMDLGMSHKVIDITSINELIQGSALTSSNIEVPHGHYEDDNMKITVVPNRNSIFLNLALGYALSINAKRIFYGPHAGDNRVYEDCRDYFVEGINEIAYVWGSDNRGGLTPQWIRAFFEAEGCFTYNHHYYTKDGKKCSYLQPIVLFAQKEKHIIDEIQKFFYGYGSIYYEKPNPKHILKGSGIWRLRLSGQDCRLMIDLMRGHFKTETKEKQFNEWYKKFEGFFNKEINSRFKDRVYEIQKVRVVAPFMNLSKAGIVALGSGLNVPFELTYSCYEGQPEHCGLCGTCVERKEAFEIAKVKDPTKYKT